MASEGGLKVTPEENARKKIQKAAREGATAIDLSGIGLRSLPPEIGQLSELRSLNLRRNQLEELPRQIARLTQLQEFGLGNNQLSSLPKGIARLTQLQLLNLSHNRLSSLPIEICQLAQLQTLDLSHNQLSILPTEIGQLTQLQLLNLSHNRLSSLPIEIGQLTQLQSLYLKSNPLLLPPEILEKSNEPQTIITYYRKLCTNPDCFLDEAKVLLVGQGNVGKTSLVNRLVCDKFNLQENKTDGIEIRPLTIAVGNREIRLNIWDFGGQEIMHATHQFFLTHRSLYLLVLDTRNSEEENRLEYWLKMIRSFGSNSPVIIIGNKIDQHPLDLDRTGLQQKYPSIKAFLETSCYDGRGIEELKECIRQEVSTLEHVNNQLPRDWFEIKKTLSALDKDYIPYEQYIALCEETGINDDRSQRTLVSFLHDLGIVLNFQNDPRLEDTNVLKPEWVTNAVYKIINDRELIVDRKGILELSMLQRILDPQRYPRHKHSFIVELMQKFELCFGLSDRPQHYLIPDIIPKEEPYTGEWYDALTFEYHYSVLPTSIISRFIVRMHRYIHKSTYWRSGVVLAYENCIALVKCDREEKNIMIRVRRGSSETRRSCLTLIRREFEALHDAFGDLGVVEKVRLPQRPEVRLDYKDLLSLERNGRYHWWLPSVEEEIDVREVLAQFESHRDRPQPQKNRRSATKPNSPTQKQQTSNRSQTIDRQKEQDISLIVDTLLKALGVNRERN